MRALTVRHPWAWAIQTGRKRVEYRTWAPRLELGEVFAIHVASKARGRDVLAFEARTGIVTPEEFELGVIICLVEYRGLVRAGVWRLGKVTRLARAVPCRGQLGLWTVPRRVEARVRAALVRA